MISIFPIKKLWILLLFNQILAEECVQKSKCVCSFENGSGYDLTPLDTTKLLEANGTNGVQYIFHPCSDTTLVPNKDATLNCSEYAICLYNEAAKEYTTLATTNNSILKGNSDSNVYFEYNDVKKNITTTISLACTTLKVNNLFAFDTINNQYNLILYSEDACLKQIYSESSLSTGAILIITFLIIAFAYLAVGICVDYFLMGARGIEIIPNLVFWKDLPFLVRDGIKFVQNGCKIQPSDLSENRDIYTSI